MASGIGINGGVGRCYPFFQAFEECMSEAIDPKECLLYRDDYFECISFKKQERNSQFQDFGNKNTKQKTHTLIPPF
jgi:NADH dehydrogenase (ubiquinone) Fe-S protein 5